MKINQICSYYSGSPLYKNLFESLDNTISQTIYVPYQKNLKEIFNNRFYPKLKNGGITYKSIWETYNRFFYKDKIAKVLRNIDENKVGESKIIHAHTWFSDGGVAYELNKKTNKPFIIAIRNTDVNFFYKYRIDLRKYGHKILFNANKIILISPSYKIMLRELLPYKVYSKIENKFEVIPNGINDFWFDNTTSSIAKNKKKDFIYVGDINNNKNIDLLIKSFVRISSKSKIGKLKLVGFRNLTKYEQTIKDKYASFSEIEFYDRKTKEEIKEIYSKSDIFIMISKKETFGLVYIEALSQGLPIIYSKGQGVDGYFDDIQVGEKVDFNDTDSICNAMLKIANNYDEYQVNTTNESIKFNWETIGLKYLKIYNRIK